MAPSHDGGPATARCRIFIVDDHSLVREGLQRVIAEEPDLAFCGEADDVAKAQAGIERTKPDVVVLDLSLRDESGLDLINRLRTLLDPPRILVLSMHEELRYAEGALRAGAQGYVVKRESSSSVVAGIRQLMQGRTYVSGAIAEQMAERMAGRRPDAAAPSIDGLTDRELEVFLRIGRGQETRRIAEELHLSLKTVQTHCAHIKEKLGLENATALMRAAVLWVERRPGN